jgi:hypothetical protein
MVQVSDFQFTAIMRSFWHAGVDRVSPGAFGMVFMDSLGLRPYPFIKSELLDVVARNPWVRWDGDWMVRADGCR